MSNNHTDEEFPSTNDLSANPFYEELARSLQSESITDDMDMPRPLEVQESPRLYTLRRLWLPQPEDALQSSRLLDLVIKYKQLITVCNNIGLTLLDRLAVQAMANDEHCPEPTEEFMGALAEELPQELRLTVNGVAVLGKTKASSPGKRFIGFKFDSKSDGTVKQDRDRVLHGLMIDKLPGAGRTHLSIFSTEDPVAAKELAADLRAEITFPGKVVLGKAKPMPM